MGLGSFIKDVAKGTIGLFTGSSTAVDSGLEIVKKGMDGVDSFFYTDQEKAQTSLERAKLKLKAHEGFIKFMQLAQGENTKRSITRRIIAWAIIGLNIFLTLYYVFICSLAVIWTSRNEQLVWLAARIIEALKYWGTATAAVVTFYFGYYAVSNVVEKWNAHKVPPPPEPVVTDGQGDEEKHIDMSLDK